MTPKPTERGEMMREFWIRYFPDGSPCDFCEIGTAWEKGFGQIYTHDIRLRVIEYSALTALEHKLEVAIEGLERAHSEIHSEFCGTQHHPFCLDCETTLNTIKGAKTDESPSKE